MILIGDYHNMLLDNLGHTHCFYWQGHPQGLYFWEPFAISCGRFHWCSKAKFFPINFKSHECCEVECMLDQRLRVIMYRVPHRPIVCICRVPTISMAFWLPLIHSAAITIMIATLQGSPSGMPVSAGIHWLTACWTFQYLCMHVSEVYHLSIHSAGNAYKCNFFLLWNG